VYDCRLLRLERRTASPLLIQGFVDDGFDTFAVAFRRGPYDLGREVVNECYRPAVAVDPPLDQVCIEEEK
jgi:hypothetical protein